MGKIFVVGGEQKGVIAGSKLFPCEDCSKKIWVSPHNFDKRKICMDCAVKRKADFCVSPKDIEEACKYIAGLN